MSRGAHNFRKRDLDQMLDSIQRHGIKVMRIDITPGQLTVITDVEALPKPSQPSQPSPPDDGLPGFEPGETL